MPTIGADGFDILPFVEGRVVHDDHSSGQEFGQKVLRRPCMEDVGVDIGCEQAHGQECLSDQGADDTGWPLTCQSFTLWQRSSTGA